MADEDDHHHEEDDEEQGAGEQLPGVDERGFPIGTAPSGGGGRLVATANPLQLKMERMKKEQEEKAKAAAKKAALQNRLAAFQGKGEDEAAKKKAAEEAAAKERAAAEAAAKAKTPTAEKTVIDSRVADMMKSEHPRQARA